MSITTKFQVESKVENLKEKLLKFFSNNLSKNKIKKIVSYMIDYNLTLVVQYDEIKKNYIYIYTYNFDSKLSEYIKVNNISNKISELTFPFPQISKLKQFKHLEQILLFHKYYYIADLNHYLHLTGNSFKNKQFMYLNTDTLTIYKSYLNKKSNEILVNSKSEAVTMIENVIFNSDNGYFLNDYLVKPLLNLPMHLKLKDVKEILNFYPVATYFEYKENSIIIDHKEFFFVKEIKDSLESFLSSDSNNMFTLFLRFLIHNDLLPKSFSRSKLAVIGAELRKIHLSETDMHFIKLLSQNLIDISELKKTINYKKNYAKLKQYLNIK